jgi:chromosome partitioning protein
MIISVINNKGGTGKTTTCVNLSAALAHSGYRILLVDMDSQASASLSLGIQRGQLSPSTAEVLFGKIGVKEAIRSSTMPRVDLLTGEMALANADLALADVPGRERRLTESLAPVKRDYDFIICDCAPSLSMLAVNALVAADRYMVTVTPEYLALEGLVSLMKAVEILKTGMNIPTKMLGILFTLVNPGLKISKNIMGIVREHYGKEVFITEIRRDVKLTESPSFSRSIFEYAPKSRGAEAYAGLAEEVVARCDMKENGI